MSESKLSGTIEGYRVRYLPKKIEERSKGITVTKSAKVAAFLEVRVDNHQYVVPAMDSESVLDDGQEPTPEVVRTVNSMLEAKHPMRAERKFKEIVTTRGKRMMKRYELVD